MTPIFVPGPVDVAPEVLAAQARPMMPHRSRDFEALFQRTEEKLRRVFFTAHHIFQVTASGSALQEAAVRNFVQDGLLVCVNGAYSERWCTIATANGKQADTLEVEWGEAITPERLADALKKRSYEAVAIVHNETSTGVESPIQDLAEAVHAASPDTLILVDAASSLGGVKIEMDAWGIDFLLTCSQECLALPPGLSFAAASDRAMQKAESVANRGWYLDLLLMEKHRLRDSTPATPAMGLIYALDTQMDRILVEGIENRFTRHAVMAEYIQSWAERHGMPVLARPQYRSKTITSLENTRNFSVSDLNKYLSLRGIRIANGYGKLRDRNFRIAHMGELHVSDCEALTSAIEEFIR
jgi:aspartate aminotransferase-like enzyme